MTFTNRAEAGRRLADCLMRFSTPQTIVVALPRGGVAVGYEVAVRLRAPLDVVVARKVGSPQQPELAVGAVAPGGVVLLDRSSITDLHIDNEQLDGLIHAEIEEMRRRESLYRQGRSELDLRGKTVLLVDDGLATGMTAHAAIMSIRRHGPASIVLAVPVSASETIAFLRREVEEAVRLIRPRVFHAVGAWYKNFDQLSDADVIRLLDMARVRYEEPEHDPAAD
ncbi:MAG: phosphoribosyltransferase [Capsulimonadaceae bacterium]